MRCTNHFWFLKTFIPPKCRILKSLLYCIPLKAASINHVTGEGRGRILFGKSVTKTSRGGGSEIFQTHKERFWHFQIPICFIGQATILNLILFSFGDKCKPSPFGVGEGHLTLGNPHKKCLCIMSVLQLKTSLVMFEVNFWKLLSSKLWI